MQIGNYQFQPTLLSTMVVLAGIAFLLKLGSWQLDRAVQKRNILQEVQAKKTSSPLMLPELDNYEDKKYYRLQLDGQFNDQHYLLLDNRFYKGRVGFEVIQPMVVGERVILVNRGWIPLPRDRNDLPQIPVIDGAVKIIGEVHIPGAAIVLKQDQLSADTDWPKLIQSIDLDALDKLYSALGISIEPWILRQESDNDPFYRRAWIFVSLQPDQHLAYAATWFGLAFVLLIIYIAAVTSREDTKIGTDRT